MRSFSRPTLKDVARLSGVSEISVSRVMRNAPNVSEKLKEKVQVAAAELNYTPNRVAGALASVTTDLVGVILPSMSNSVFPVVLDGIDSVLSGTAFRTVLGISHYDVHREEEIIRDILAWNPAGIIITGFEHSQQSRQLLQHSCCPVIEIMDADGEPIDASLGVSHEAAGKMMAEHFYDVGYKKIGYIGAWGERPLRSKKRRIAFEQQLARRGIPLVAKLIEDGDSSLLLGKNACAAILNKHPEIEALFFANDDLACGALLHCSEKGIQVPEQIGLAGFNGLPLIDAMALKMTTIKTPRYEMGVAAAKMFLTRIGAQSAPLKVTMPLHVLEGDTTVKAK